MKKKTLTELSRRERQIMDIIYRKHEVSAAEIREHLPDKLTDSGVRTLLRIMVNKGYLQYKKKGAKYIYFPTITRDKARYSALKHLKQTFFDDSAERVITALLKGSDLTKKDLDKFIEIINKARKEGK